MHSSNHYYNICYRYRYRYRYLALLLIIFSTIAELNNGTVQ
jgi:hypothetical protein